MRLSADGSKLLVVASDDERIDVIDIAKLEVERSFGVGDDPEMFDFSLDGKYVYVSNEEDAKVSVIDFANGRSSPRSKSGRSRRVMMSLNGKHLYVTSEVANMVL